MSETMSLFGDKLLTEHQLAEMLGVPVKTVRSWRLKGRPIGPPFVKIGFRVRYRMSDVREYATHTFLKSGPSGRRTIIKRDPKIAALKSQFSKTTAPAPDFKLKACGEKEEDF